MRRRSGEETRRPNETERFGGGTARKHPIGAASPATPVDSAAGYASARPLGPVGEAAVMRVNRGTVDSGRIGAFRPSDSAARRGRDPTRRANRRINRFVHGPERGGDISPARSVRRCRRIRRRPAEKPSPARPGPQRRPIRRRGKDENIPEAPSDESANQPFPAEPGRRGDISSAPRASETRRIGGGPRKGRLPRGGARNAGRFDGATRTRTPRRAPPGESTVRSAEPERGGDISPAR